MVAAAPAPRALPPMFGVAPPPAAHAIAPGTASAAHAPYVPPGFPACLTCLIERNPPAGGPGPLAATRRAESPTPSWNLWTTDDRSQLVESLRGGRRYTVTLDISPYLYEKSSGEVATSAVRESIQRAIQDNQKWLHLKVRPIEVSSALRRASAAEPELDVDLDVFRNAELPSERTKAMQALGTASSPPALSDLLGAGKVAIAVDAMRETGCAQIALAIFDASGTRPIDHLVYSLPIAENSTTAMPAKACPARVQGGFAALAAASPVPGRQLDATLHMFQFRPNPEDLQTTMVYVDTAKYRAAPAEATLPERGVYTWNLRSNPLTYIGKDIQPLILQARDRNDYRGVATELADKLFPHAEADPGTEGAAAALKSIRSLVARGRKASLLARAVALDGSPVYAPLGLLAVLADTPGRLQVFYPLPREDYAGGSCIENWTLGVPKELEGLTPTPTVNLADSELLAARMQRLATRDQLLSYLDPATAAPNSSRGEAFLLLAHHDRGYLWFRGGGSTAERIPIDRNNRQFPRGSVAFLNVCSAGNPTDNNQEVLRSFNRNGIDAMVVSPFPVDSVYGTALARAAIAVVKEAYEAGTTPTLADLLDQAAERAKKLLPDETLDARSHEFLLLGNEALSLCKR